MPRRRLGQVGGWLLLALAAAVLVAAGATVAPGLLRARTVQTAMAPPADAPAWQAGPTPCRVEPMAGVPNPTRFVVVAACVTVRGTVVQVRRDPADGEVNMMVAVDRGYARFLAPGSQGLLRAAIVPRDVPGVTVPVTGQHATLYGSWVQDRNQHRQLALHPVWKVELAGGAGRATSPPGAGARRLRVALRAPPSVPVGGAIDVQVRVGSGGGAGRPVPAANLFFEIRGPDGRGVQWKATTTNALGRARVTLVALESPGAFRLWLYADKPGRSAVVSAPVTVRRR